MRCQMLVHSKCLKSPAASFSRQNYKLVKRNNYFTSKKFALVLYFSSWFIFETPGEALRFRKFAAHLPSRQWGYKMNLCAILKVPVFIRRVFFILIRNLDLQKGMCFHYSERNQS